MRGWLYSSDEPEGKIFDGAAYHAALKAAWVDTPALLSENGAPEAEADETPKKKPGRPRKDNS